MSSAVRLFVVLALALGSQSAGAQTTGHGPNVPDVALPPGTQALSPNPSGYPSALLDLDLPGATGDLEADAWRWISDLAPALGLQDPRRELAPPTRQALGERTLLRFRQQLDGVPVVPGMLLLVVGADGRLQDVTNGIAAHRLPLDEVGSEEPLLSATEVVATARRELADYIAQSTAAPEQVSRLVYYAPVGSGPVLAWEVHLPGAHLALNPRLFYDAGSGRRLAAFNDIRTIDQANVYEPSPGRDGEGETVERPLPGRDDPDGWLTGPLVLARNCVDDGQTIVNIGPLEVELCSEIQVAKADAGGDFLFEPDPLDPADEFAEVHMYYHVSVIYEYFQGLGLDELDEAPLPATVNFRIPNVFGGNPDELAPFDNAFFYPAGDILGIIDRPFDSIVFGQGERVDFAYDGDVIYHEFGHAVFEQLSSPGSVSVDEWGLTSAPGAINEGQGDYFAAAFTGDPEIGEYVGPRIGPAADAARNIRDLGGNEQCPGSITGEVHLDSVHFSSALWDIRSAYLADNVEASIAFDTAVLAGLARLSPTVTFDQAAAIIEDELSDVDEALEALAESVWSDRGVVDCQRFVTLGGGLFQRHPMVFLYGPDAVGLEPFVPGFVQYRVVVPEEDPQPNTIVVNLGHQGAGTFGGTAARPGFVIRYAEPVRVAVNGTEVAGNWTAEVESESLGQGRREARWRVEGGLEPGEYYLLPVGTQGSQAIMSDIGATVLYTEAEPEPEPEPEVEPDAGADAGEDLPAVPDVGAETGSGDGTGQPDPASGSNDGCGCATSGTGSAQALAWAALLGLGGILRRRRRLN